MDKNNKIHNNFINTKAYTPIFFYFDKIKLLYI